MKLIIDIPENVYIRLFDCGIQDNEIAVDDVCEMARALRMGTPLKSKWQPLPETESLISRYQHDSMSGVFMASPIEVIKVGEPLSNSEEITKALEKGELYKRGFEDAMKRFERPKGEWSDESKDSLLCSACGKRIYKPFIGGFPTERTSHYYPNFCAFCGADMRKGEK